VYLNDLLRGFHLELDNGVWARKTRPIEWWGYLVENKVLRWLTFEYDSECDWRTQTDEHPPAAVSARGSCGLAKTVLRWIFRRSLKRNYNTGKQELSVIIQNHYVPGIIVVSTAENSMQLKGTISFTGRTGHLTGEFESFVQICWRFSDRKVNGKFVEISRALLVFLCYSYMNVN